MNKVTMKIKLNNKTRVTETGYLSANYLLDQLIENEHISKIYDNVIVRLDNLLYDGYKITEAHLDIQNEILILHLDKKQKYNIKKW